VCVVERGDVCGTAAADGMSAGDERAFAATRWTVVVRAQGTTPEAKVALSELCAACYEPVRGFIRVWRRGDDRVDDLTHEFFEEILGRRGLAGADPGRGKFRSFLLGAVKHFLGRVSERERALKRGGGVVMEEMEAAEVVEEPGLPPDAAFDRGWALALLARALGELERQMGEDGRAEQFAVLKLWLTGDAGRRQVEAAEALGMTETAVKVAIHRLRARFRGVVRAELAATLVMPEQVDEELGHLMAALQ